MRRISIPSKSPFGKLTIQQELAPSVRKNGKLRRRVRCLCECGNVIEAELGNVKSGNTKSCGCWKPIANSIAHKTHGLRSHPMFNTWTNMKGRCTNKRNKRYVYYGARGIAVCEAWLKSFQAFYDWGMSSGWKPGLTIERKDVNGNYEPSNCTWVPQADQNRNKRNHHMVTYNGVSKPLFRWCEEFGLPQSAVHLRLYRRGWSVERALETPIRGR